MFDQFLRFEVNSSGLDTTRFFGGFNNSQISEAEMVYGFDYRCALAKMLPEVLDTEGCISCSRMSRPCHGCLDQGFDPFEGNGTTSQKEVDPDDLFLFTYTNHFGILNIT